MFAGGAEIVHVAAGDHGEKRREGGPGFHFGIAIAGSGEDFGDPGSGLASHFLGPNDHDCVINTARDRHEGVEESRPAGCAGILEAGRRNAGHTEPG